MTTYQIKISDWAENDLRELFRFLTEVMSRDGANRYIDAMLGEILSLTILADLFQTSRYADVRRYHPQARRMVSHNKRWAYIFHLEDDTVVVDRIRPTKMITK